MRFLIQKRRMLPADILQRSRNIMANVINKVVYGGTTLIDLTADTVTAEKLYKGATAHKKDGTKITGTAEVTVSGTKLIMPEGLITVQ